MDHKMMQWFLTKKYYLHCQVHINIYITVLCILEFPDNKTNSLEVRCYQE